MAAVAAATSPFGQGWAIKFAAARRLRGDRVATERINRKLAAILAADVVGFSRLTGLDEEGTARRLAELRTDPIDPAIAAYGGRIFKTMGDGLLIEFGSVVDATRCALDCKAAWSR